MLKDARQWAGLVTLHVGFGNLLWGARRPCGEIIGIGVTLEQGIHREGKAHRGFGHRGTLRAAGHCKRKTQQEQEWQEQTL